MHKLIILAGLLLSLLDNLREVFRGGFWMFLALVVLALGVCFLVWADAVGLLTGFIRMVLIPLIKMLGKNILVVPP